MSSLSNGEPSGVVTEWRWDAVKCSIRGHCVVKGGDGSSGIEGYGDWARNCMTSGKCSRDKWFYFTCLTVIQSPNGSGVEAFVKRAGTFWVGFSSRVVVMLVWPFTGRTGVVVVHIIAMCMAYIGVAVFLDGAGVIRTGKTLVVRPTFSVASSVAGFFASVLLGLSG